MNALDGRTAVIPNGVFVGLLNDHSGIGFKE